jgi:hypothetical protein
MRINDVKSIEEETSKQSSIAILPDPPKLDDRQLLASLFNRNYYDTDDQIQDFNANGIEFFN